MFISARIAMTGSQLVALGSLQRPPKRKIVPFTSLRSILGNSLRTGDSVRDTRGRGTPSIDIATIR
jgi:hypothetical protein